MVLGPPQPICHQKTEDGVPVEQAVSLQKLRPGSGILSLRVHADGPTRVLEVTDRNLRVIKDAKRLALNRDLKLVKTFSQKTVSNFCLIPTKSILNAY